jgi:hypothetical protein
VNDLTQKMREVLLLEREKAFLSQALATIHTDLDIHSDFSVPFSRGLQNHAYTELLKHYEFRSLLPQISNDKEIFHSQATPIHEEELQSLFCSASRDDEIYMDIENDMVIFSFKDVFYTFDARHISIRTFLSFVRESEVTIAGYDIKNILHKMYHKEKSLE